MEPKIEQPKQYAPKEIAELEKSRTISDAELLKGGAEYVVDEKGEKENLLVGEEQKEFLKDKELQGTIDILDRAFGIKDPKSRDEKMRNVSLEDIRSIINSTHKKLYITYKRNGRDWDLRLWSDKPCITENDNLYGGHVDWSTNYSIALAEASTTVDISDIHEFLDKVQGRGDFGTREVSVYVVS